MIKKMIAVDWRAMKYYQLRGLMLPLAAFIFGVVYSPLFAIPLLAFFGLSFSVNPFAVEEKGELNNLYLSLPIKRSQIVIGRYALSFIIVLIGIAIGIPIMILSNTISFSKYFVGVEGIIAMIAISFLMYSVLNLFMFPTLFKLGYQKGKMWGFYLPAILFAILIMGYYLFSLMHENQTFTIDFLTYATDNLILVSSGLIILSIALLYLSCMISIKIYSKRDF